MNCNFIVLKKKEVTYGYLFFVKSRLFELLEERRLSIHALTIKSGMAPSTIKNILYGKSKNPGIVTLKILCDGLGISLFEFFNADYFSSDEP